MDNELEQQPPPVVEGVEARVARLEERMDDVEAAAGAALMMHLEDDVDEVERTEVEPRTETKADEKKVEEKVATGERHAGMFL